MLFNELNTNVLLQIYGYLDLIDSINLADTCRKLRDVAQLHYKRFKILNLPNFLDDTDQTKRHNSIDATTLLKHIGYFICVLIADLNEDKIGSNLGTSIRKYCVNVKSLKIKRLWNDFPSYNTYSKWVKKLNLTKISLPAQDLLLMDLSETTALDGLHIYSWSDEHVNVDILERNLNVSSLRVPVNYDEDFNYEIFEKLKCLKRLGLYIKCWDYIEIVSANLNMTQLEKVELLCDNVDLDTIEEYQILLKNIAENALNLKDLSILKVFGEYFVSHQKHLPPLHLFKLTSLRLNIAYPNIHKELPAMQPNLEHLDLLINEQDNASDSLNPMEQIIFLIQNLEKLKVFHIKIYDENDLSSVVHNLRQESVICRIFNCCSIGRPTLQLYVRCNAYFRDEWYFLHVKLDFNKRKWTVTDIPFKRNYFSSSVKHQSLLPCCY
ncbi:hypothetical protein HA402_015260 [Bradysia odoriphaga]|nr:hypothetical protein HA402_015260 [Bradysia odoriphaga]